MQEVNWKAELDEIKKLGSMGWRMPQLAEKYGVSRQRIKQILLRYIPEWNEMYGAAVAKKERQDSRYAKWGVQEDSELYYSKRQKFRGKKANATRVGQEWSITFGDVEWPTHCPILGIELDYFCDVVKENSVSFDRIDSTKGYIKGNVHIISWRANRIKNNGTLDDLRKLVSYFETLDQNKQGCS